MPDRNRQVEFTYNRNVQQQLQELRGAIVSMPNRQSTGSVTVPLGTSYPSRLVALNTEPPVGSLRTVGTGSAAVNVSLSNATVTGETGDFWNGTTRAYSTGGLVYRPRYNEYRSAPETVYENTVLYNEFRQGNTTIRDQALIDGKRVRVIALNGSLGRTEQGSLPVDVEPLSSSDRRVSVRNATSNVTLTIPTRRSASTWRSWLADERVTNGGHVVGLTGEPLPDRAFDLVHVHLEPGVTYTLAMARVGVGTRTRSPGSASLTDVTGNGTKVPDDGTQRVVVEVRDRYNNPVSGVEVNASADVGTVSAVGTNESDNQGRARSSTTRPRSPARPRRRSTGVRGRADEQIRRHHT